MPHEHQGWQPTHYIGIAGASPSNQATPAWRPCCSHRGCLLKNHTHAQPRPSLPHVHDTHI